MASVRRLLSIEDLLWALWLLVLDPARGSLFLDGGIATFFLLGAGLCFWVSTFLSDRSQVDPRRPWLLAMGLGVCTIMIDAALKQVGADMTWRIVNTVTPLGLGLVLAIQHRMTGGRTWLQAPTLLRRALAWPLVMILADNFAALSGILVDTSSSLSVFAEGGAVGFISAALRLLVFMPMIYAFFVVAPRRLTYAEEGAGLPSWIVRYLWALLSAWVGAALIQPLSAGL